MTTPVMILVGPQMVENIGMAARAMMNCGLTEMRIVNPRDPWPLEEWLQERLYAASSGANEVLDNVKIFASVAEAIADLHHVYATMGRKRELIKNWVTARAAAPAMRQRLAEGQRIGVMFGPERTGLLNDDVVLANEILTVPLNPEFASLNLAQAVLVIGYEWYQSGDATPDKELFLGKTRPAAKEELLNFFDRLEAELETAGFFAAEDMRPHMIRNLRNTLQRAEMTEQEIRTWHGVVAALVNGPKRGKGR